MGIFSKSKNAEIPDNAMQEIARNEARIPMPEVDDFLSLKKVTKEEGAKLNEMNIALKGIDPGTAARQDMLKKMLPAEANVTKLYTRVERAKLANNITIANENDPDFTDKYPLELNA